MKPIVALSLLVLTGIAVSSPALAKRSAADQAFYEQARKACNNPRLYPDGARPVINYKDRWFRCQEPRSRRR